MIRLRPSWLEQPFLLQQLNELLAPVFMLQAMLAPVVPLTRHELVFLPQLAAAEFAEWLLHPPLLPGCLVGLLVAAGHFAATIEIFLHCIGAPSALNATSIPRSHLRQVGGADPQPVALIVSQSFGWGVGGW